MLAEAAQQEAIHPAWFDNPIVREAARRLESRGEDLSGRDLLFELSGMLNELEDRFPGVPFADILAARTRPDPEAVRRGMSAAGVSPDDIDTVLGAPAGTPDRKLATEANFDLVASGADVDEIMATGVPRSAALELVALRQPYSPLQQRIVDEYERRAAADTPPTTIGLARLLNTSRPTVYKALAKRHYLAWLDEGNDK